MLQTFNGYDAIIFLYAIVSFGGLSKDFATFTVVLLQLNKKVGEVELCSTVIDYLEFSPKDLEMDDSEYGHLVEIYDFDPSLKTSDLMNLFMPSA